MRFIKLCKTYHDGGDQISLARLRRYVALQVLKNSAVALKASLSAFPALAREDRREMPHQCANYVPPPQGTEELSRQTSAYPPPNNFQEFQCSSRRTSSVLKVRSKD